MDEIEKLWAQYGRLQAQREQEIAEIRKHEQPIMDIERQMIDTHTKIKILEKEKDN